MVSRTLDRNDVLYNGLHDESSSLSLPVFIECLTTAYFFESGNTLVEKQQFTISVNIAVIGSEIISKTRLAYIKWVIHTINFI